MTTVTVTFDANAKKAKFTFVPYEVSITAITDTILWNKDPNSIFKFVALAIDHQNPLSDVIVQPTTITAIDANDKATHMYSVLVKANGTYYNSKDDPTTMTGGPTIKNN
jgi:hypothetical protein